METDAQLPTVRQLQYLVTLADTRHFRKAAEALHITQPSLSVQLKTLEDTLGVVLAERGRGGVTLTPVGRDVTDLARSILADVRALKDVAAWAEDEMSGTLRLGASPTLAPYLLPHVIRKLHKDYPDLKLYVREDGPNELQSDLAAGTYDLILTPLPVRSSDLAVDRLFREPLYFVCASDHRLAHQDVVTPGSLKGEQVLALGPRHHLHHQISNLCAGLGAELLRDYEGTSLDTLRSMVGSGLGVTFLPALYVKSEIGARGEVSVGSVKGKRIDRTIGLAWRKSHPQAGGYMVFADTVRTVVQTHFKDVTVL